METIFVPLALLAGGLLPIQAGADTQLGKLLKHNRRLVMI